MLILNIEETHVKENILGYITGERQSVDKPNQIILYKVVERHYRHPKAKEYAFIVRTEVVEVQEIPPEYEHSVHLLDHHEKLMKSLMDDNCREEHSVPQQLWNPQSKEKIA